MISSSITRGRLPRTFAVYLAHHCRDADARSPSPPAAPQADDIEKRGHNLNDYFTYSLYVNVCRSLFETHKLMFSFLLTIKIMQNKGIIDGHEWRFLLAGATSTHMTKHNPAPEWLTDKSWIEVLNMSMLPHFEGFDDHMIANIAHYRAMFDSNDTQEMALAEPWNEKLNSFQKLLFLRCLRPDKVILGTQAFVAEQVRRRQCRSPCCLVRYRQRCRDTLKLFCSAIFSQLRVLPCWPAVDAQSCRSKQPR